MESGEKKKQITYKQKMSWAELFRYLKAVGLPVVIFLFTIFCIDQFGAFGSKLIAPLVGGMWAVGAVTALVLPSQRSSVLNETMAFLASYMGGLYLLRLLISITSGVSSQMLMASFETVIPQTAGNAFLGVLQSMLWAVAILTPLGFVVMEIKRIVTFKKQASQQKTFDQLRSIRK